MRKLAVLSFLAVVSTSSSSTVLPPIHEEKDVRITCNEKTQTCYLLLLSRNKLYNLNYVSEITIRAKDDIYGGSVLVLLFEVETSNWRTNVVRIRFASEERMRKFLETIIGQPVNW